MSGLRHPPGGWDPFRDFEHQVGRLFQSLNAPRAWRVRTYPPLNLYETAASYVVTAEAPGMDAGSLDLSLAAETLTIRGERKRPDEVPDESYRRRERPFGRWSRTVALPGRVDAEKVSAHYAHGILTVTLPKVEDALPRQIAVTTSA